MFSFNQHLNGFLETGTLDDIIEGVSNFSINSNIEISDLPFPDIKRLGKRAEFIFEQILKHTDKLEIIANNIQLIEKKRTIGEIDYLLKQQNKFIHLELATKFYLLDESLDDEFVNQWIGPNRKDFLHLKLSKLTNHQFPIIHNKTFKRLNLPEPDQQSLLLKAMLFVPAQSSKTLPGNFQKCLVGSYYSIDQFLDLKHTNFFIPSKINWFINPNQNNDWKTKLETVQEIKEYHKRKFSPLVWIKSNEKFERCFVVWW